MTFRLPQNLSTQLNYERGESVLNYEIMAEKAASLGRAGKIIETALARLQQFSGPPADRLALVHSAADAVHAFLIQRELCGMMNHDDAIAHYEVPREVLAKLGAK